MLLSILDKNHKTDMIYEFKIRIVEISKTEILNQHRTEEKLEGFKN